MADIAMDWHTWPDLTHCKDTWVPSLNVHVLGRPRNHSLSLSHTHTRTHARTHTHTLHTDISITALSVHEILGKFASVLADTCAHLEILLRVLAERVSVFAPPLQDFDEIVQKVKECPDMIGKNLPDGLTIHCRFRGVHGSSGFPDCSVPQERI